MSCGHFLDTAPGFAAAANAVFAAGRIALLRSDGGS